MDFFNDSPTMKLFAELHAREIVEGEDLVDSAGPDEQDEDMKIPVSTIPIHQTAKGVRRRTVR